MKSDVQTFIKDDLLVVQFKGFLNKNILINTLKSYSDLEGYEPDLNRIWDFRNVTEIVLEKEDLQYIKSFMDINRANMHSYRVAYVSDRNLIYGLSRMFGMMAETLPIKTRTFRSYDKALAWVKEKSNIEESIYYRN